MQNSQEVWSNTVYNAEKEQILETVLFTCSCNHLSPFHKYFL